MSDVSDTQAEIDKVRQDVLDAPAPGTDPDSKQRLAKHLAASGVDLPDGYSTDPVTDEQRAEHAGTRRKAAGKQQSDAPKERTATPARHTTASDKHMTASDKPAGGGKS